MSIRPKPAISKAKSAEVIHYGPMTFSMIEKQALLDMDQLIAKEATAARVLNHLIRLTEPGSGGVVIISRATLGQMLGVSDPTVGRAIRVLVAGNWIQRMRVGGAYALAVNRSVAWTGPRGHMQHAVFQATVVASRDEQEADALSSPDLRRVPTSYPGEIVLPAGDVEPPAQDLIPGTEPTILLVPYGDLNVYSESQIMEEDSDIPDEMLDEQTELEKARAFQANLETAGQQRLPEMETGEVKDNGLINLSEFMFKLNSQHYGQIKIPRLFAEEDGTINFDIKDKQLYFTAARDYPNLMSWYLYYRLGRDWVNKAIAEPMEPMHPAIEWHQIERARIRDRQSGINRPASCAEVSWRFLGYHLALIADHAELSKKLISRLKLADQFQGARFEVLVAVAMIAAGFDLKYAPEKGPGTHPEFIATDLNTGMQFAVEAKSISRYGILGSNKTDSEGQSIDILAKRQLKKAIKKNTPLPMLVFVDLNLPNIAPNPGDPILKELVDASNIDMTDWKESGFPCVGGFFYNDAGTHFPNEDFVLKRQYGWALPFYFRNRHNIDPRSILMRIHEGFKQSSRIPDIKWSHPGISD